MELENLSELSDEVLLEKIKKIKTNKILDNALIGFTIGIVVYSAVKTDLLFLHSFPCY
ncbi:hypothetical protein BDE36_3408 [Arcticibacter tournemirensis]|nr:hypothetical protein BDE36_3408 [Arcticibacter tournemirensis]